MVAYFINLIFDSNSFSPYLRGIALARNIISGIPEFLDSGRWTLNAGHWNLDAGFWTLILRTVLILSSQRWCVSQRRNDTLIILQTKNRVDSFFITGKYHTKKKNITNHLKVFLNRVTH